MPTTMQLQEDSYKKNRLLLFHFTGTNMSRSVAYVVHRNFLYKHLLVFSGHNFAGLVMCMVLNEHMITCN